MRLKRTVVASVMTAALVAVLAPGAQAKLLGQGRTCIERTPATSFEGRGTRVRDLVQAPDRDSLARWIRTHRASATTAARVGRVVTVPVWFHVIREDLTIDGGNLPRTRIVRQVQVLNDAFSGATGGVDAGLRFELAGITRTTNARWFALTGSGKDKKMKTALKVGGPETLNIYSAKLGQNLLGYAYLASDAAQVGVLDGVVVPYQSLPGRSFDILSWGAPPTPAGGAWFDLFHTFDGGCQGDGDFVEDTAAEASPAFNCPVGRDTCAQAGLDPITNFMDYTQDSCMFEFTDGQGVRMRQAWTAFRA